MYSTASRPRDYGSGDWDNALKCYTTCSTFQAVLATGLIASLQDSWKNAVYSQDARIRRLAMARRDIVVRSFERFA